MAAPLKLLLWHLGRRGGGPRYTLELARALSARDDVELSLALSRQSEMFEETAAIGAPVLAVDTYRSMREFAAASLRLPAVRRQFAGFTAERGAQVALCSMTHLWFPWLTGPIRRAGARRTLVVHDAAPHPGDRHAVRGMMMRHDFRQADWLVTLTDAVAQRLVSEQGMAPERIIHSRMGPFRYRSEAAVPRRLGEPPFRLMFFGRLLPYKGLDLLIEAMRQLRRDDFPARLRLIGQGPLELSDLPDNIDLDRRWVPEEEVPDLFAGCDLVVLPYREASQSGVLPIAQNMAVPSLVTPVGGLREQVAGGESGFIAEEISAAGLARAIRSIFAEGGKYEAMSKRLAEQGGDRQWTEIADRLIGELSQRL